jgi:hypothetical protein
MLRLPPGIFRIEELAIVRPVPQVHPAVVGVELLLECLTEREVIDGQGDAHRFARGLRERGRDDTHDSGEHERSRDKDAWRVSQSHWTEVAHVVPSR